MTETILITILGSIMISWTGMYLYRFSNCILHKLDQVCHDICSEGAILK